MKSLKILLSYSTGDVKILTLESRQEALISVTIIIPYQECYTIPYEYIQTLKNVLLKFKESKYSQWNILCQEGTKYFFNWSEMFESFFLFSFNKNVKKKYFNLIRDWKCPKCMHTYWVLVELGISTLKICLVLNVFGILKKL